MHACQAGTASTCPSGTYYQGLNSSLDFHEILCKISLYKFLGMHDCRKNRCSDTHPLFRGVNKFLCAIYIFDRCGVIQCMKLSRNVEEQVQDS